MCVRYAQHYSMTRYIATKFLPPLTKEGRGGFTKKPKALRCQVTDWREQAAHNGKRSFGNYSSRRRRRNRQSTRRYYR